jgi:hypothetical protein
MVPLGHRVQQGSNRQQQQQQQEAWVVLVVWLHCSPCRQWQGLEACPLQQQVALSIPWRLCLGVQMRMAQPHMAICKVT